MNPFPRWILDLPEVDTPFTELDGRLLAGSHGQVAFFRAEEDARVPPHSHGAQWGIVVTGRLELTIAGETATYEPGDTYEIGAGQEHAAFLPAGCSVIDFFADPDRYEARP